MSFALVVILLKAGLGIEESTLKRVGRPAVLLGFIPCLLEGVAVLVIAYYVLDFSFIQSGLLAFIISAVSPAIVIPSMVELKEKGLGMDKGIPTMNLAATSIDDVVALSMFGIFLNAATTNQTFSVLTIFQIPVSIILGILLAYIIVKVLNPLIKRLDAFLLFILFIVLSISLKLYSVEWVAGMISIMSLGYFMMHQHKGKADEVMKYVKVTWNYAHIFLFVLIGVIVDISVAKTMLSIGLVIISIGLFFRIVGVILSLIKTEFNIKEKVFVGITNIPKATVQASIGGIPLSMGISGGEEMLSLAVLSIVVTAPLGLILIRTFAPKMLNTRGTL
jgi:NhaP-type Na+/H+ or K+/H+ antiporter